MWAVARQLLYTLPAASNDKYGIAIQVLVCEYDAAATFLLLDALIVAGPTRALTLKAFMGSEATLYPKKASRLISQLAARIVGCVFLALALPPAFTCLGDSNLSKDKLYASSEVSSLCMTVTAGYFVYDVFICLLRYQENGTAYLIHAIGCCSIFLCASLSATLHYFGAAFLMWELSTPFLYFRWVLLKLGKADSTLAMLNSLIGFLVFFCCRNCFGPYISWDFFQASALDLAHPRPGGFQPASLYLIRALNLVMNGLNFFWLSQMARVAFTGVYPSGKKAQ